MVILTFILEYLYCPCPACTVESVVYLWALLVSCRHPGVLLLVVSIEVNMNCEGIRRLTITDYSDYTKNSSFNYDSPTKSTSCLMPSKEQSACICSIEQFSFESGHWIEVMPNLSGCILQDILFNYLSL